MLSLRSVALTIAIAAGLSGATGAPPAAAALPWAPCTPAGFQCAQLDVPIDSTGAVPGTVPLAATRFPAPANPSRTAVVALAGGPGQAALPFADSFKKLFASALSDKDLLVFDQRGTGKSGQLRCPSLGKNGDFARRVQECSASLGPRRAFYTTAQSVQDIEALRVAGGYDKLILFGVSYGTKVALAYAAAHPASVSSLILDSVVTPEGPDALDRSSLAAVPRVIGQDLCGENACAAATPDAIADLTKIAGQLGNRSIKGAVYSGSGRRYTARLGAGGLVAVLSAGDLNPALRSEFPAAVRSALRGDKAPLLRLSARSAGLDNVAAAGAGGYASSDDEGDGSLYLATICEEDTTFPWTRGAPVSQREGELKNAVASAPAGTFGLFPNVVGLSGFSDACLGWSVASAAPAAPGPLPDVPVLILDGQADLRTPIEDAQNVAARFPHAQLVTIPDTGHSVLSAEFGACATTALATFLRGEVATVCPASPNPLPPVGRAPRTLSDFKTVEGLPAKAGRTLNSMIGTLADARIQIIGDTLSSGTLAKSIGGLRGGSVRVLKQSKWQLRSYEYVPGVRISGTYDQKGTSTFTFFGSAAASGRVSVSKSGAASGTLGGTRFRVKPKATAAALSPELTLSEAVRAAHSRFALPG